MSTAIEMPESLAALLPKVRRKPLPLSRKGKTAALLVSVHEYQKLRQAADMLEDDDPMTPAAERALAAEADKAMAEKPLSAKESAKFLADMRARIDK